MDGSTSGKPKVKITRDEYGEFEFTREVALVHAEELAALELQQPQFPVRRVPPEELETALGSNPLYVVLDRLEERSDFNVSHDWVMRPHGGLDGDRPVEAVHQGRVQLVLSLIEMDFPLPDRQ